MKTLTKKKTIGLSAIIGGALLLTSPALANPNAADDLPPPEVTEVDPAQSYRDGLAALEAEDYKTAEKKFGEVLRATRDMPEANYYMGVAKVGRGKDKSSIRYFERAIEARPDYVEAREQLALIQVKLEETEKATEQLGALKQLQADCAENSCDEEKTALIETAIAKVEAALAGEAYEEQSAAPDDHPNFAKLFLAPREAGVARYAEAVKFINQDRYEDAIAELENAQAIVGPHPDILNYLGYSNRKLGRFDAAKAYYAAALKLDPNHRGATEYLGELYLELGEIGKAKKQLARLDEICAFACAEREDLARLIDIKEAVRSAER